MITGSITDNKNQIILQNNPYFNRALEIISAMDFSIIDDGTFEVEPEDFFYMVVTYKTKGDISQTKAESHRNYIDFQYIIYGEELVGYSGCTGAALSDADYDLKKDIELYNVVSNESFFILKRDMFCIFYPNEIHRPGLASKEERSVRKAVFKIKIKN